MIGLLLLGSFLLLMLLRLPIAFALAIPAVTYILYAGFPVTMVAHRMTLALDSVPLLAVPLFILVGSLMNQSGMTTHIFRFASDLVSHWRAGLAQVNILVSLIFSGTSGAALADIGGVGQMEIRAMVERGYKRSFAAALTAASATVGPIFPPSIPLIIYAAVAEVSALRVLIAGIVPALVTVVLLMVATGILARFRQLPASEGAPSLRQIFAHFASAFPALLTPVVLISGMLLGVFSPTEAAAVTVGYILLISVFIYRGLTFRGFIEASIDTVRTTSSIMIVVAAAALFGWALTVEQVPQAFATLLLSVSTDLFVVLLIVNLLLIVAGMFLETISALLIVTPIVLPPLVLLGADPVHIGVIIVFNLMIGLLTPPMGMSLFLVSSVAKAPLERVLRELVPYFIPLLIMLLIITYVPAVSLWLPEATR